MVSIPKDLKYTEEHEWLKIEGDEVKYGITDYAQEELGDIVYVELPEIDEDVEKGELIGVVESVKTVSDLFAPISGKITRVNDDLEDTPELINEEPYADGWIAFIKYEDGDQIDDLLSAEEYESEIE
ncbi:MAG: glycine cleavage system protein GcvH [Thermoplasmata archaeon]